MNDLSLRNALDDIHRGNVESVAMQLFAQDVLQHQVRHRAADMPHTWESITHKDRTEYRDTAHRLISERWHQRTLP